FAVPSDHVLVSAREIQRSSEPPIELTVTQTPRASQAQHQCLAVLVASRRDRFARNRCSGCSVENVASSTERIMGQEFDPSTRLGMRQLHHDFFRTQRMTPTSMDGAAQT